MPLVLSRKLYETIKIGGPSEVKVVGFRGKRILLSIKAEREVVVLRGEVEKHDDRKRT